MGVALAQCCHAAGESARLSPDLPADTHAVILRAENEAAILRIEAELCARGIVHAAIREPDEPWCGALMAIGLKPMPRDKVLRRLTGHLPLYK